jgi:hypothetical protein
MQRFTAPLLGEAFALIVVARPEGAGALGLRRVA